MKELPPIHDLFRLWHLSSCGLRFGQWFYNSFDDSGIPDPDLFYCGSTDEAYKMISKKYYNF